MQQLDKMQHASRKHAGRHTKCRADTQANAHYAKLPLTTAATARMQGSPSCPTLPQPEEFKTTSTKQERQVADAAGQVLETNPPGLNEHQGASHNGGSPKSHNLRSDHPTPQTDSPSRFKAPSWEQGNSDSPTTP